MLQEETYGPDARKYGRLVAKAWTDPDFQQRLRAQPAAVLREEGVEVPAGTDVQVVDGAVTTRSANVLYFCLPPKPASLDEELSLGSGGLQASYTCSGKCWDSLVDPFCD